MLPVVPGVGVLPFLRSGRRTRCPRLSGAGCCLIAVGFFAGAAGSATGSRAGSEARLHPRVPARLTPPGTHLRYGETATVPYQGLNATGLPGYVYTVALTVSSISQEPNSVLVGTQRRIGVPYYIHYTLMNVGGGVLGAQTGFPVPLLETSVRDNAFFGSLLTLASCSGPPLHLSLMRGESWSGCVSVATHGRVSGAEYSESAQGYIQAPVTWSRDPGNNSRHAGLAAR